MIFDVGVSGSGWDAVDAAASGHQGRLGYAPSPLSDNCVARPIAGRIGNRHIGIIINTIPNGVIQVDHLVMVAFGIANIFIGILDYCRMIVIYESTGL